MLYLENFLPYFTDTEQIATIRKKNAATDKMVKGWFRKGLHDAEPDSLKREVEVQKMFEGIFECGQSQNSFMNYARKTLSEKFEEESNGETAIRFFKEKLWGDNFYFSNLLSNFLKS